MKKLFVLLVVVFTTCSISMAQPRAIGARLGLGVSASYQHSLGENMLQADLDLNGWWGLGLAATYNWVFPISGNWNWYAGVGGGAGFYWYGGAWWGGSACYVGVAGMIGVEYSFNFPLQLSLDWRPIVGPSFGRGYVGFNMWGLYAGSIGLGVRYKF